MTPAWVSTAIRMLNVTLSEDAYASLVSKATELVVRVSYCVQQNHDLKLYGKQQYARDQDMKISSVTQMI